MQRVIKNNSLALVIRELDYKLNYTGRWKPYYSSTLKIKTPLPRPRPQRKPKKLPNIHVCC